MRIFCFPHAGGGSLAYRGWRHPTAALDVIPVVLPGREALREHRMPTRMTEVIDYLIGALGPRLVGDYAFFGHSFGAGVAYELTRRLHEQGARLPRLLAVSGRRAPNRSPIWPPVHTASDETFLKYLVGLGGIPSEVVENPALLQAFLPSLRADFAVHETYVAPANPSLPLPVSAFTGAQDPAVSVADVLAWRDITTNSFRARVFPGGHFYLREHGAAILSAIHDDLEGPTPR
ncbi:thioesterase II family protein [Nocardia sp. XZ_19_369]|uniref:thioesterase II family protein n=1 Tax=Nocardia sp. XZ_19_369 TaxID=2769487 RepID=UPI00188E8705|nr:thioesterase [Nocardia sp. XZ_19_369]